LDVAACWVTNSPEIPTSEQWRKQINTTPVILNTNNNAKGQNISKSHVCTNRTGLRADDNLATRTMLLQKKTSN